MFEQTLSDDTKSNLAAIASTPLSSQFYLAGGTALGLYFGHRRSFDLDFFIEKNFDIDSVWTTLKSLGTVETLQATANTFNGRLNGSRLSFFIYPYRILQPFTEYIGAQIASLPDLAAMKADAITRRGTKRDFVDLFTICQKAFPLEQSMAYYFDKFSDFNISRVHVFKSLVYFEDADQDEMPDMIQPVKWADVKKYFTSETNRLARTMLD